jgi:hypothetical protein
LSSPAAKLYTLDRERRSVHELVHELQDVALGGAEGGVELIGKVLHGSPWGGCHPARFGRPLALRAGRRSAVGALARCKVGTSCLVLHDGGGAAVSHADAEAAVERVHERVAAAVAGQEPEPLVGRGDVLAEADRVERRARSAGR